MTNFINEAYKESRTVSADSSGAQNRNAGLLSDGELVQAVTEHFVFLVPHGSPSADDKHAAWSDLLSTSPPVHQLKEDGHDSDLADAIICDVDGGDNLSITLSAMETDLF